MIIHKFILPFLSGIVEYPHTNELRVHWQYCYYYLQEKTEKYGLAGDRKLRNVLVYGSKVRGRENLLAGKFRVQFFLAFPADAMCKLFPVFFSEIIFQVDPVIIFNADIFA